MESVFKKDRRTGVVLNDSDQEYQRYLQNKQSVKSVIESKNELIQTKQQLNKLQQDFGEIKNMLQQLLKAKE